MGYDRISRQHMFMDMAEVAAKRATCFRGNVGALVVYNNAHILSMGYNGPPPGEEHCRGNDCQLTSTGGCRRSVHAEVNAISRAYEVKDSLKGCDIYCTMSPCPTCCAKITMAAINRVFYRHAYRITDHLVELDRWAVEVYQVLPSGVILDHFTRRVISPEELRNEA